MKLELMTIGLFSTLGKMTLGPRVMPSESVLKRFVSFESRLLNSGLKGAATKAAADPEEARSPLPGAVGRRKSEERSWAVRSLSRSFLRSVS